MSLWHWNPPHITNPNYCEDSQIYPNVWKRDITRLIASHLKVKICPVSKKLNKLVLTSDMDGLLKILDSCLRSCQNSKSIKCFQN